MSGRAAQADFGRSLANEAARWHREVEARPLATVAESRAGADSLAKALHVAQPISRIGSAAAGAFGRVEMTLLWR